MSDYGSDLSTQHNLFPAILAGLNVIAIFSVGMNNQTMGVGFWDAVFVLIGTYLAFKFITYLSQAHEHKESRVSPKFRSSFSKEGIYAKIRHPVGAGLIYLNIGCVLLFRSLALIPVVPVFFAMWFILAKYQDNELAMKFGDEYKKYMQSVGMFRGKGDAGQRLEGSGYGMH